MADGLSLLHRRALRWVGLTAAVLGLHLWLMDEAADHLAHPAQPPTMPPRLQVSFVREMALVPPAPPPSLPQSVAAPTPLGPVARQVPVSTMQPKDRSDAGHPSLVPPSAEGEAPVGPVTAADPVPVETADAGPVTPDPDLAAPASDSAAAPVTAAAAASVLPGPTDGLLAGESPFTWPESTRLSYRLTGNYMGEVHGRAQVEWILAGPRYQVNLDVTVGLSFAPLFSRQMRSEGSLGPQGLQPEQYEETSRLAFRDRRLARLQLDPGGVLLAQGERWTPPVGLTPPGAPGGPMAVQDSASQFVQLTYLFTRQPQLLATGQSIALLLALPGRVVPWVYEVAGPETLYTAFGPVETFHVRPAPGTPRGTDLLAEAWFAPGLAHLPVRIRIEQAQEVFIDLMLERRPELAAAPSAPASPAPR